MTHKTVEISHSLAQPLAMMVCRHSQKYTRRGLMNDNKNRVKPLLTILVILGLAGCASIPQDAGFNDVQSQITQRTGNKVYWNQGTEEDQEVHDTIDKTLAKPLTAEGAVQIALVNNRRLQATYEDLGLAQADLVQAGLLRNPIFDGGVFFTLSGASPRLDFGLAQDFLSILYLPLRKGIATANFEAVKLEVTGQVLDMAARVKLAFYQVQADQQLGELLSQVVDATEASAYAAERLYDAGNIKALELHRQQSFYQEIRLALARAEAILARNRERLTSLMGLWGQNTQWKIVERLHKIPDESLDTSDLERRAVAASLDLDIHKRQIESAARRLGLSDVSALIPDAETGVGSERDGGEWDVGPTLSLPIPLFDQGQGRSRAASSDLRRARQNYYAQAVEIRSAVRTAQQLVRNARERTHHWERIALPLRTQIVGESQLQYNAGQIGVFDLLMAERQQINAGMQYIITFRDYWLARTQLEQILNGRLTDFGDAGIPDIEAINILGE